MTWTCRCGAKFPSRGRLAEHIALRNPRWPLTTKDDEHGHLVASLAEQRRLAGQDIYTIGDDE